MAPRLAIAAWLAVSVCIGVTWGMWRGGVLRPHGLWAAAGITLMLLPLAALAVVAVRRLWTGRRRLAGLGWLLIGATPLVWVAGYYAHLIVVATSRESLRLDTPLRIAVAGALTYFDLEARLRYPRWTHGRHATLMDRGETPDAERLVLEMDRHLEAMAGLIGRRPPDCRIAWVRGSIFGMNRRAMHAWALCGRDEPTAELTGLDRHEAAHSLITLLAGPDHDPPMLLVEGWAEYHSEDRTDKLVYLHKRRREETAYPLRELVKPRWYGRSAGPAYWQGGPLVNYLIERFGAEKFFELYAGVRRPTFDADVERLLGESWDELDERFWRWVELQGSALAKPEDDPEDAGAPRVEFADGVDRAEWDRLIAGVREAGATHRELPSEGAYAAVIETIPAADSPSAEATTQRVDMVFEEEAFWCRWVARENETYLVAVTPNGSTHLQHEADGTLSGQVNDQGARLDALAMASYLYKDCFAAGVSNSLLPWREASAEGRVWRIDALEPPNSPEEGLWDVRLTRLSKGDQDPTDESEHIPSRLVIDPRLSWSPVVSESSLVGEWTRSTETRFERLGNRLLPIESVTRVEYPDRSYSTRYAVRELTPAEAEGLRAEIDQAIRRGPTPKRLGVRRAISVATIGTPLLGLALLGLGAIGAREPV